MCNITLSCPLCCTPNFHDLETLKIALIKVTTEDLPCPICGEIYTGLDKLTIHLFSHREIDTSLKVKDESDNVNVQSLTTSSSINEDSLSQDVQEYKKRKNKSKNSAKRSTVITNDQSSQNLGILQMNPILSVVLSQDLSAENLKSNSIKTNDKRKDKTVHRASEKCDICGFSFLGINILEMHKKLIHRVHSSEIVNGVSHYCCHICSKVFKMKGSLMVHLRMVHFDIIPSTSDTKSENNTEEVKGDLEISNVESESNKINLVNEDKSLQSIAETSIGRTWKCDICEKNFTTKYFLKKHKRLHTGEMPYSCSQCNKTFTFQQSYHKHLLYHNDEKPHTCSHCGRSFKELSTLHNHQRIHTGEKPFECETCGKCFRQRVSYLVHRRIHTGAMPFKCTACEKSFRYKVSQRMHKCTAQPPGTVVRQSGELVQKLIQNQMKSECLEAAEKICNEDAQDKNCPLKIKAADPLNQSDIINSICNPSFMDEYNLNFVDKSNNIDNNSNCILDEIVQESISKIDFSDPKTSTATNYTIEDVLNSANLDQNNEVNMNESLPSPSDRMRDLKISSTSSSSENPNVDTLSRSDTSAAPHDFGIPFHSFVKNEETFLIHSDNTKRLSSFQNYDIL